MDNEEKTVIKGRYEIIRPIGYGGMAKVFLAHDLLLDRNVAVKMLRDQFLADKELLDQFRREAKSAAKLVHPYIINIYDVVDDESGQYIVMEYVEGTTLKEYMKEHKLSLNNALEIAVRLADGLQHAHSRNVIHCDIKPHNILLDKNMNPKIADFGIAKMVSTQTMVYSKSVMGSVHYISPEQASGGKLTASSDVYSLGVVLFEMLTGHVPFNGDTAVAVAMMHTEKPVPRLTEYMDEVPAGLQEIIDKALAKKPEDRYHNAGDLRRDLLFLKMKLFPFSSEDYTQEMVGAANDVCTAAPVQADAGSDATVIMKPVRCKTPVAETAASAMEATAPLPTKVAKAAAATTVASEAVAAGGETSPANGEQKPKPKRKLNYLKILVMATVAIFLLSMVANFVFNRNLAVVEVPDVTNMTVVEAQRKLEELDLKVELEEKYGDPAKFKPGTVMEQSRKPGEKCKQKSLVILTISRGAELKPLPDVVGMTLGKAELTLENAGFKVGKITKKYDPQQRMGNVLAQSPKGTEKTPKGSAIELVVNEGENEVPNIIGKKLEDAKNMLAGAGLKVGEVKTIHDNNYGKDIVVTADPSCGSKLAEGTAVNITISDGGEKKNTYVEFVVPGTTVAKCEVFVTDAGGRKSIYSGVQRGGVRLRRRVEYNGSAKVEFFANGKLVEEKTL